MNLLGQVEPRDTTLKLEYDIPHLMISECENSVDEFSGVLQRHCSCLDDPAGLETSLVLPRACPV